ncbi:DUF1707 domain-containing protein [Streptomyces sodiiphilus]|uniref:DUF1707 domain-containing protein n=1 Tax=Streptomyces sodiiphilus TaxID=226217 RepID=A0ABP5AWV7_9ACTN
MTEPSHDPARAEPPYAGLRASHADREAVAERLREAAGDGRLDLDELESRLERALTAKTYGELEPLTADLPAPGGAVPALPGLPAPGDEKPLVIKAGWAGAAKDGAWQVASRIVVHGSVGGAKLDFTQAQLGGRRLIEMRVSAGVGGVVVVVPQGWEVRTDDIDPGMGGVSNKVTDPGQPGAPVLHISGAADMGGVKVRHPNRWERRRLRHCAS